MNSKRRGFTLLELLAVIAIIAILAGILFPALRTMQERGQRASCLSNLRQWGAAMKDYLADSGGVFPTEGVENVGGAITISDTNAWFNVLAPYIGEMSLYERTGIPALQPRPKDGSIYTCPAVTMQDMVNYEREEGVTLNDYNDPFMSYGMNLWIDHNSRAGEHGGQTAFSPLLRFSQILKPSKFVVFGELAGNYGNLHAAYCHYRHDGDTSVNLCFADGHAATYKKADIYVDAAESGYKVKNKGGIIWDPEGEPPQTDDEF